MNILYIEHYAGSPEMGMEFRPYYLSREWTRMGHRVTIIAGDYSHLRKKNPVLYQRVARTPAGLANRRTALGRRFSLFAYGIMQSKFKFA